VIYTLGHCFWTRQRPNNDQLQLLLIYLFTKVGGGIKNRCRMMLYYIKHAYADVKSTMQATAPLKSAAVSQTLSTQSTAKNTLRFDNTTLCRDYNCDSTIRYDYESTTYRACLLPIRCKQKTSMSIFRRSRIVVKSQYCDIGFTHQNMRKARYDASVQKSWSNIN